MFKPKSLILISLIGLWFLVGCDPESVEVEVTREVEKIVEVTREVQVEIEVPKVVVVTPAAESSGTNTESVQVPVAEADVAPQTSTLRIPHGLIWSGDETLDPYAPTRFAEYALLAYERLIRLDQSGNLVAGLATAWEPNGDSTAWTLTLRDGVFFHDGTPLTAADVVYSLETMTDPSGTSSLAPVLQQVTSISAAGANQVTIGLSAPNVEFPLLLTDPRAVILRDGGGRTIFSDGIGTGPFRLANLDALGITELVAFDGYWGGRPTIDQVEIIGILDIENQVQAMLAGQIDILDRVPAQQAALFASSNEFSLQSVPTGNWRGFVMRTDTAPFDNPAVRKALRVVADRQAMIDAVLGGAGTVACDQPVWRGDRYWTELSCAQDVELAKSLLAEAGFPNGIDVTIHTSQLDPYWPAMLDVYAQQAQAAGIRVSVVDVPIEAFWTSTWLIEPFVTTSWNERPAPLIFNEAWRTNAAWNETYWSSSAFDTLLDQAAAEPDLATRKGQYTQLQTTLSESGGAFIPFHLDQTRVVSTCIAGVLPQSSDHIDFTLIVKTPNCN